MMSDMDGLSDDLLLGVLCHVPVPDLMRARGVCRRWRDLSVHVNLWRERHFASPEDGLLAALHFAPCAASVYLEAGAEHLGVAVVTTACAAAELTAVVQTEPDAVLAALAIRNQVKLGRLKALKVEVQKEEATRGRAMVDLLSEIHRTEGLTSLWVGFVGGTALHLPLKAAYTVPGKLQSSPSLKVCTFRMDHNAFHLRPHWEFQLGVHATTLEEVYLGGLSWPPGIQASLFNGLPNLRVLWCPLLEDMQFLEVRGLQRLDLYPGFEHECASNTRVAMAMENAKVFFRRATELRRLDLRGWGSSPLLAAELVAALASSRRAKLEALHLREDVAMQPQLLDLPGLPALAEIVFQDEAGLAFENIPDALLQELGSGGVPSLAVLDGVADEVCRHEWLHGASLRGALRANPRLHVVARDGGPQCRGSAPCAACSAGDCHRGVRNWDVAVCAHAEDGDADCDRGALHTNCDLTWFHLPEGAQADA